MSESPSFDCRACGACCRWNGHVLLTEDDIGRLAQALELSEREFIDRHTVVARNRRSLSLADGPDGACVFLEGHRCRVYAARPEQCRTFPVEWFVPGCPAAPAKHDRA